MRRKTVEELRASANARAKRWREKNARKHRERVKELYGRSKAQKHSEDGVTPVEVERYARRVEQETHYDTMESVEADAGVMAEQAWRMEKLRPPVGPPARKGPEERVVARSTEEELRTMERLAAIVGRKKREVEVPWE